MGGKATWYVLTDGAKAKAVVLEAVHGRTHVSVLHEMESDALPNQELQADRPGRVHDRVGSHRHAAEPRTDPHRENKARFAGGVAEFLDEARKKGAYSQLILIAPPKTLGDLRATLSPQVQATIKSEFAKDLTGLPVGDLAQSLEALS